MKHSNHTTHIVHCEHTPDTLSDDSCLSPYCAGVPVRLENVEDADFHHENSSSYALAHIIENIGTHGQAAAKALETHIERVQNHCIAYMRQALREEGIVLEEKITLSLSSRNTLLLECASNEDALLAALGNNEVLVSCLRALRKSALTARGLQYLRAAQAEDIPDTMPQYKVCAKGELSHFYLKHE